jgi:hypothetical protein
MQQDHADLQALRRIAVQPGEEDQRLNFAPGGGSSARGEMGR